ncbi:MAG: hypothetical protein R2681_01385 [Pyrinomonadaceae bacterium]
MNRRIILLIVVAIVFGAASAIASGTALRGNAKVTLKPDSSYMQEVEIHINKRVDVRANADQGSVRIKVLNPNGKTVASGTNRVSFKSGKLKGKYKIEITNGTKKLQKVDLIWTPISEPPG